MYKMELITNNEILLKDYYFTTWEDTYNKLIDLKNLELDNIIIDIFKDNNNGDFDYLGDFNQVRTTTPKDQKKEEIKEQTTKTKNKILKIILSITILILTFIISFITSLTKK